MINRHVVKLACTIFMVITPLAYGHKQAERYIPIGQSPGLSHKYTYLGAVAQVDMRNKELTVRDGGRSRKIRFTAKTRIWLDRSKLKMTNLSGKPKHIGKGQRIEVKYMNEKTKRTAEWIKVEITDPGWRP